MLIEIKYVYRWNDESLFEVYVLHEIEDHSVHRIFDERINPINLVDYIVNWFDQHTWLKKKNFKWNQKINNNIHTRRLIFSESWRLNHNNGRSSNGFADDKTGLSNS